MSDSHGNKKALLQAVALESPNLILHLGDHDRDCHAIEDEYPEIPMRVVRGNCDFASAEAETDVFQLGEKRIFMTHGHLFRVKIALYSIYNTAIDRSADILLFGHTHTPHYEVYDRLTVINPGSISGYRKTYAVLEIKNSDVTCNIRTLDVD